MTQIKTLRPYKYYGQWVFDDEATGLDKEAFVAGADTMIDVATEHLEKPEEGFVLLFSGEYFPTAQIKLDWVREDGGGNVYYWPEANQEGWLCPALFKYFDEAPKEIYAQVKEAE